MRIPQNPLKLRKSLNESKSLSPQNQVQAQSKIDTFLERVGHLSQLGLLVLGVSGYFYTVLPLFENQLLREQTSQLELEKKKSQQQLKEQSIRLENEKRLSKQQLAHLKNEQKIIEMNIKTLENKWLAEKNRNSKLSNDVIKANEREIDAREKALTAESELRETTDTLDSAQWELVLLDFSFSALLVTRLSQAHYNSYENYKNGDFIQHASQNWPKLYPALLSSADEASKKGQSQRNIPARFYIELKTFIQSKEKFLECEKPDFDTMQAEYLKAYSETSSIIDNKLKLEIDKLKDEYKSKGGVKITDDYLQTRRKVIEIQERLKLVKSYDEKIDALRNPCINKVNTIIDELYKDKGIISSNSTAVGRSLNRRVREN